MAYTYEDQLNFAAKLYCPVRKIAFRYGVHWKTIMAQLIEETGWGKKVLPGTNNLFNIKKAGGGWEGKPVKRFTVPEVNAKTGQVYMEEADFRVYVDYVESLEDRFVWLLNQSFYKEYFSDGVRGNHEKEVYALAKKFATNPKYADNLLEIPRGRTFRRAIALAESEGYCNIVNAAILEENGDKYRDKEVEISVDGETYLKKKTTQEGLIVGMVVKPQGNISFKKNNIIVPARIPVVKGTINIKVQQSATVIADKLEEHQGNPSVNNVKQQEVNVASRPSPAPTTTATAQSNDVSFKIKIIEGDSSKAVPDLKYAIRYKNNLKEHTLNGQGEEKITAERGQKLEVFVRSAKGDFSQKVTEFVVNNEQTQVVKLPLVKIRIKLFNHDKSKVMSNYRVISHYRGQQKPKVTDGNGLISLTGLAGLKIKLTLPQGNVVVPDKVLDSQILEYTYLIREKYERQDVLTATKKPTPTTEEQPKAEPRTQKVSEDKTAPISQADIRGGNGHPIKMINRDGEFGIYTKNKETGRVESGLSYVIKYENKNRAHTSGKNGDGFNKHKGFIGKTVSIFDVNGNILFTHIISEEFKAFTVELVQDQKSNEIELEGNSSVTISYGKNADPRVVSQKSINILKMAASKSSNKQIMITSTARKPYDQARIMYQNIISKGMAEQRRTYKAPGQRVLDVYDQNKNLSKEQVIGLMEKRINELGPSTVSKHLADPRVKNTFDISLGNIINQNNFKNALLSNDSVEKVLVENGCFHVEIKQ
ncbi:glucosaminidase domain-containing protein [Acinetobacter sp. AG3]|jgi:Mannosyl-glycoprotein endo-beta-N-acetylglucosaminidase|uniref:glucosaminidase domain-containing protein n=1 Tax=unclassified Acinetobacter TaxID=196816 RepID=UPI001EF12F87|nr:glucosaminidase domain-containing protein [Acinetobacter sp. AG3]MCG7218939.1 glucosaminidase domain-containing protein [Acinetobacter sp. AG3]